MACCCSLAGTAACDVCANRPSMFASSTTFTPPTPIVTYVPERTCRNVSEHGEFQCSECDQRIFGSKGQTHNAEFEYIDINYCPNCGARVVNVDGEKTAEKPRETEIKWTL